MRLHEPLRRQPGMTREDRCGSLVPRLSEVRSHEHSTASPQPCPSPGASAITFPPAAEHGDEPSLRQPPQGRENPVHPVRGVGVVHEHMEPARVRYRLKRGRDRPGGGDTGGNRRGGHGEEETSRGGRHHVGHVMRPDQGRPKRQGTGRRGDEHPGPFPRHLHLLRVMSQEAENPNVIAEGTLLREALAVGVGVRSARPRRVFAAGRYSRKKRAWRRSTIPCRRGSQVGPREVGEDPHVRTGPPRSVPARRCGRQTLPSAGRWLRARRPRPSPPGVRGGKRRGQPFRSTVPATR